MGKILPRLYTAYAGILFISSFLILFPFFLACIHIKSMEKFGLTVNRWWAKWFFTLMFIPVETEWRFKLDKTKQYIFCPNHFSFLDIPLSGYMPVPFKFIGKSSIKKVPLFGYMFRKLHIMVDREKLKSRYHSLRLALETLDDGYSLVIFPEGGILSEDIPNLYKFKDGAFRAAVAKGIPIVPVTYPFNYLILADDGKFNMHWGKCKMVFHEAIETKDLGEKDIRGLKDHVYTIIQDELNAHFANNIEQSA